MPQDIPLEASDTLAFTPASLASIDGAPVFQLRAVTSRDKRFRLRLHREKGIVTHSEPAVRAEIRKALIAWSQDKTEAERDALVDQLDVYWQAKDDFDLMRRAEPELQWSYDEAIEEKILEFVDHAERNWKRLAKMSADAAEYAELEPVFYACVTVKSWAGLDVKRDLDRGYLTDETGEALRDALYDFEVKNHLAPGLAWIELYVACLKRFSLDQEEAGNSASPSPSPTPPAPSTAATKAANGKSPARARSRKTRSVA